MNIRKTTKSVRGKIQVSMLPSILRNIDGVQAASSAKIREIIKIIPRIRSLIRRVRIDLKGIGVDEGYRGEAGRWPIRKRKYERKRYSPAG